jgi:hypothetical protein
VTSLDAPVRRYPTGGFRSARGGGSEKSNLSCPAARRKLLMRKELQSHGGRPSALVLAGYWNGRVAWAECG